MAQAEIPIKLVFHDLQTLPDYLEAIAFADKLQRLRPETRIQLQLYGVNKQGDPRYV